MDDEHARVGAGFGDDIAVIARTLLGGGPGAQRLLDGEHVVVHGLGQTDHGQTIVIPGQERRQVRRGGIGVVAADGVQDVHAVLDQLVGRDFLWVIPLLDQATLDAVLHIGQLDAAIADRRTAELVQQMGIFTNFWRDLVGVAQQQSLVAAMIGDDFDAGIDLGVTLDQAADGGAETGRETASGQECNFLGFAHGFSIIVVG